MIWPHLFTECAFLLEFLTHVACFYSISRLNVFNVFLYCFAPLNIRKHDERESIGPLLYTSFGRAE